MKVSSEVDCVRTAILTESTYSEPVVGVAPSSGSAAFVIGGSATAAMPADNAPADSSYVPPIGCAEP